MLFGIKSQLLIMKLAEENISTSASFFSDTSLNTLKEIGCIGALLNIVLINETLKTPFLDSLRIVREQFLQPIWIAIYMMGMRSLFRIFGTA